jgi:hypothetical protein
MQNGNEQAHMVRGFTLKASINARVDGLMSVGSLHTLVWYWVDCKEEEDKI